MRHHPSLAHRLFIAAVVSAAVAVGVPGQASAQSDEQPDPCGPAPNVIVGNAMPNVLVGAATNDDIRGLEGAVAFGFDVEDGVGAGFRRGGWDGGALRSRDRG